MNTIRPEAVGVSSERLCRINRRMQRYVDEGKIAGIVSMAARHGQIAHCETFGMQEIETRRVMQTDTLFRIYSMTKPITSTAVLMLLEEGCFQLSDPVSRYIPELKDLKVLRGQDLEDCRREMTIRDLLTHTAGLSYGFEENSVLDEMLKRELWEHWSRNPEFPLPEMIRRLARLPLAFQPGTQFHYSLATDVLGYLVQVVSGKPFDTFLKERIFEPLGMVDTGFFVPPSKLERFAANYGPSKQGGLEPIDVPEKSEYLHPGRTPSGGGGLVSTAMDYLRFAQMLLNGGELEGVRLLGRKTVELMTMNHLPPGVYASEGAFEGFGLGVSVLLDVAGAQLPGSLGTYGWGGAANTTFWVDPQEKLIGVLMLQFMPSETYPVIPDFRVGIYQALVD